MQNLSSENQIFLTLAKYELNEDDKSLLEKQLLLITDWDRFYYRAVKLGIGSFVSILFQKLTTIDSIPEEVISRFNSIYHRSLLRNILLYEKFQKIHSAFSNNGIPVIPLKGIYLAESLYKDIGQRQMSDIDLLVYEKDTIKCLQLLSDMGFVAKDRIKTDFIKTQGVAKHLPTMVRNDVYIEIHYLVSADNSSHTINIEEYWQNAKTVTLFNTQTLALSFENLLQYLCIHLERHFSEGKIQLYQFTDLYLLFRKNDQSINWDLFEKSCILNNCIKNVGRIMFLLHKFFSLQFPENINKYLNIELYEDTTDLFIHYLNCDEKTIQKATGIQNLKNLKTVKGTGNRIRFVVDDLFPSRTFMYQRYKIKHKHLLLFYYLKRLSKGLGLIFHTNRK